MSVFSLETLNRFNMCKIVTRIILLRVIGVSYKWHTQTIYAWCELPECHTKSYTSNMCAVRAPGVSYKVIHKQYVRGEKNESGFRPPLCTYRLNWARRTSWGWWDDWDDTVLQTQDSKFEPWRSEAEHATSRSRRLPTILTFTRGWGRNNFCFFQTAETGNRTPDSGVKGSGANHYPRAPARARWELA